MGLSSAQARYIFITDRMHDLEAGLLKLSAEQLRLADESSDIEERRDYELNLLHMEFNGNANFTYDDFMGENAINNGQLYFLTTNDGKNRVVLNQKYADGIKAAGISEDGGEATQDALIKFANTAAKPKDANDWKEVITGNKTLPDEFRAVDNFKSEFGVCPQQGMDPAKAVDHYKPVEKTEQVSFNDILNKMGSTGNFNGIPNTYAGSSRKGTTTLNEQSNCNCSYADLVKKTGGNSGRVCLIDDQEDLSYDEIYKRAQAGFKNLANTIANKIADAYGDSNIKSVMTPVIDQMANQINGSLSNHRHHSESKARNRGRDDANNGLIGVAIDKTGTDQVWIYCNASELTRRLLTAASNYINNNKTNVTTNAQGAQQNYNANGTVTKKTTVQEFDYKEEHPYTNQQGKTYEQWHEAWDKVVADNKLDPAEAEEYRQNGCVKVEVSDEDKQTLEYYNQIFLKICSQGWTQDNDLGNTNNLSSKLENMQYKVNNEVIKNLKENFQQVKTNDEEIVKQRYNKALREVERKEKANEIQQTAKQTELNALQTETASVQSIIDGNVKRGFNLFA